MKKFFFLLTIAFSFLSTTSFAQIDLSKYTYYRFKNVDTGHYLTVVDNKGAMYKSSKLADIGAVQVKNGFSDVVSDPGSVIQLKKKGSTNNYYDFESQGTAFSDIVSGYGLYLYNTNDVVGATTFEYYVRIKYQSSVLLYLREGTYGGSPILLACGQSGRDDQGHWYVEPVTSDENHYFAVQPEINVASEGKYYTTLYADFPFSVPAGMKALYVKSVSGNTVEVLEFYDGKVPAKTPVILECSSADMASNKLTLLNESLSKASGNKLSGVFFNTNIKTHRVGIKNNVSGTTDNHVNQVAYDASTMRVLTLSSDGKLVFGKYSGKYLPANSAYLTVPTGTADELDLEITLGVDRVLMDQSDENEPIYDMQGRRVDNPGKGIYIQNGKKFVRQ